LQVILNDFNAMFITILGTLMSKQVFIATNWQNHNKVEMFAYFLSGCCFTDFFSIFPRLSAPQPFSEC